MHNVKSYRASYKFYVRCDCQNRFHNFPNGGIIERDIFMEKGVAGKAKFFKILYNILLENI